MDHEGEILHNHSPFHKFIGWYRYLDDILFCFTGTNGLLQLFLIFIEAIYPNKNFTMEIKLTGRMVLLTFYD